MQLGTLETFLAVLRQGSISGAAAERNLTASAVSLQMRQLEEYFAVRLFDRSGRTIRPSAHALATAPVIADVIAQLASLRNRPVSAASGLVELGMVTTMHSILPAAVRGLRAAHPALELRVVPGVSNDLVRKVRSGELDCAVVVRPPARSLERLRWWPLLRQPLVMVAPRDSAGTDPRELLRRYEWIRYDRRSVGGRVAARYVLGLGVKPATRLEMDSSDAILTLVGAGLGVSVIPAPAGRHASTHAVRIVALQPPDVGRTIALVHTRAATEDRRIRAILEVLRDTSGTEGS